MEHLTTHDEMASTVQLQAQLADAQTRLSAAHIALEQATQDAATLRQKNSYLEEQIRRLYSDPIGTATMLLNKYLEGKA